jgi:hypothetical protein
MIDKRKVARMPASWGERSGFDFAPLAIVEEDAHDYPYE